MSDENSDTPPMVLAPSEPEFTSKYTRAEAIEDGMLIDVTARAREAGIRIPMALTRRVWSEYVELNEAAKQVGNDIEGRLWDIVWVLRSTRRLPDAGEVLFQLYVVTTRARPSLVTLKVHVGPGDDGAPVLTVLTPDED
jgi:hypothetical protein